VSSFKEFMTKPRAYRQYGSFPLVLILWDRSRYWPVRVQAITNCICAVAFVTGLLSQLRHPEYFVLGDTLLMAMAVLLVVVQQIYYTRRGQNFFQVYRDQWRDDKECIAYLKEHHLG